MICFGTSKLIRSGSLAFALAVTGAAQAVGFNFTFDNDVQGWTRGNLTSLVNASDMATSGSAVWATTGSNGYILGSDHDAYAFHFSPNLGGGHGALFGTALTYDFFSDSSGGLYPQIVLKASSDYLILEQTIVMSTGFVSFSHVLNDSQSWYLNGSPYLTGPGATLATNAQIQAVLNDLQYIGISTDFDGTDITWTDNVRAVPEPASVVAMSLGLATLLRRRKSGRNG